MFTNFVMIMLMIFPMLLVFMLNWNCGKGCGCKKREEFLIQKKEDIPQTISETLKIVDPPSFPNVFAILKILATIPVTCCSCERSISCFRHLKNYLRGTMGQERLNGLALMHAHHEIALDLDEIIDLFASKHPKRMRMANILCSDDSV